jgi:hypothetical protein
MAFDSTNAVFRQLVLEEARAEKKAEKAALQVQLIC